MQLNRRQFLGITTTAVTAAQAILPALGQSQPDALPRPRAVLFDGFPIFDPRPVFALAEELFPGRGGELTALWKTRQFEYTWLRTLSGRYADFPSVTRDALAFAARSLKLGLTPARSDQLLDCYFHLPAWPDALPALRQLKERGLKLGFLSNFSEAMLRANIQSAGLADCFELLLSTDRVRAFKPDPRAYQLGLDALKLPRAAVVFAAFAGWDAAGAKSFGYRTFWVNRLNAPAEELDVQADATGTLADLVKLVET